MENVEILGIILILCGILYIFLQGMGKLSDKGGEIETKILSLKGGAGLILVALGIVLLTLGGGLLSNISEKFPLPEEVKTGIGSVPTPILTSTKTLLTSTPAPTSQRLADMTTTSTPTMPASKSVVLNAIAKESGYISNENYAVGKYWVGDTRYNLAEQSFLSFNIADIPSNATITWAELDFSKYSRTGDPFSYLGCLGVYEQNFGVIDSKDFFFGNPTDAIVKWCSDGELSSPSPSDKLKSTLQNKLGNNRFQVRVQFDKSTDNNDQTDDIYLDPQSLIVTYTVP